MEVWTRKPSPRPSSRQLIASESEGVSESIGLNI